MMRMSGDDMLVMETWGRDRDIGSMELVTPMMFTPMTTMMLVVHLSPRTGPDRDPIFPCPAGGGGLLYGNGPGFARAGGRR
jgi:hypothetical protein